MAHSPAQQADALPRVFGATPATGSASVVDLVRFDATHPRVALGRHAHHELELLFVEQGSGTHVVGGAAFRLAPHDAYLVAPGVVHDLAAADAGVDAWALVFSPGAIGALDGASASPIGWRSQRLLRPFLLAELDPAAARVALPAALAGEWRARFRALHQELERREAGREHAMSAYVSLFAVDLARLVPPLDAAFAAADPVVAAALDVVDRRYAEGITVADVAAQLGFTPGHLTTVVRRRTGRSMLEWIAERQMAEARRLLATTTLSVSEVARSVGLPDPAYFSRRFSQHHGVPPTRWRRA